MTTGREAARDLRYGRRAGRWGNEWTGRVAELLAALDRDRTRARELDRTDPLPDGSKRWPDRHDFEARNRPTTREQWQGLARMAKARHAAGLPLSDLDAEALDRHPKPASAFFPDSDFSTVTGARPSLRASSGGPEAPGA